MSLCGGAEKEIIFKIWKSLKDGNDYGNKRDHFKSGRGSYQSGGSSYDSGYKGRNSGGGSRPGGSYRGSGYENKSGGSQPESFKPKLDDYAILGLSKPATLSDIKKNFYKLAKEHHPGWPTNLNIDDFCAKFEFFFPSFADKNMHLSEQELLEKQELMKRINSAYGNLVSEIKA